MKPTSSLIYDLDFMLSMWKRLDHLFCGGCCITAAIIARELEKRQLEYRTVVYTPDDITKYESNVNVIANHDMLMHVAIEVETSDTHEVIVLGGDYETRDGSIHGDYVETNARELMKTYHDNVWNNHYDHRKNIKLLEEILHVFMENE